ncbi:MAG: hypothetical protein QXX95_05985 [Nitrososphaerales archaeon]
MSEGEIANLIEALEYNELNLKLARFYYDDNSKIINLPLKDLPKEFPRFKVEYFSLWGDDLYPYYRVSLKDKVVELVGSWMVKDKRIFYKVKERLKKLGYTFLLDSLKL